MSSILDQIQKSETIHLTHINKLVIDFLTKPSHTHKVVYFPTQDEHFCLREMNNFSSNYSTNSDQNNETNDNKVLYVCLGNSTKSM